MTRARPVPSASFRSPVPSDRLSSPVPSARSYSPVPSASRLRTTVFAALLATIPACELWRHAPPDPAGPRTVDFPRAHRRDIAGVSLLRIPAPVGTAAVAISLRLGLADDPPDRPGLTALLLAALAGHGERPGGLAWRVGALGGAPHLALGLDGALLSVEVPTEHAPAALAALLAAVRRPLTDPDELADLAAELTSARARARDDPGQLALAALRHVAYPPGHPYRRSELSGETWSIEQVRELRTRALGPAAIAVIVAGEADDASLTAVLTAGLAGWSTPVRIPEPPPVLAAPQRAVHLLARPGLAQAVIALGRPADGGDDLPGRVATLLVQSILYERLRGDMASTYSVSVGHDLARGPGLLTLRTQVDRGAVGATLTAIHDTLAALRRDLVAPAVVTRVCALERLEPMFARQTNTGLLLAAARLHWLARPQGHDERDAARPCDTLAAAVAPIFRRDFDPARLQIVVVGDPAIVTPQLVGLGLGPVLVLDPAAL